MDLILRMVSNLIQKNHIEWYRIPCKRIRLNGIESHRKESQRITLITHTRHVYDLQ